MNGTVSELSDIRAIASCVLPGDAFVFVFSGHGSQIVNDLKDSSRVTTTEIESMTMSSETDSFQCFDSVNASASAVRYGSAGIGNSWTTASMKERSPTRSRLRHSSTFEGIIPVDRCRQIVPNLLL